jgi:hypothetical protein
MANKPPRMPDVRLSSPSPAPMGSNQNARRFRQIAKAFLVYMSALFVMFCLLVLVSGCQSMNPGGFYPWSGPLTDPDGNPVPPPTYDSYAISNSTYYAGDK